MRDPGCIHPMTRSMYLQTSCASLTTEDFPSKSSPVQQNRRLTLRHRLFSRSRQRLTESVSSLNPTATGVLATKPATPRIDVKISEKGLAAGSLHASVIGGKEHCFYVNSANGGDVYVLAAASEAERRCWLAR